MNRPRILLIDDEPMIRMALRILLRVNGYDVSEAADATSGMAACQTTAPALVLLDMLLPDMSGLQMLQALGPDFARETPIVMLSAIGDESLEERAYALGVSAMILKPFRNQTIVDALRYFLADLPADERAAVGATLRLAP